MSSVARPARVELLLEQATERVTVRRVLLWLAVWVVACAVWSYALAAAALISVGAL